MTSRPYLKEHRLGEVISLIQVLAFHRNTSRSEDGLEGELRRKPLSADSWIEIGKAHPEIFRVRDDDPDEEKVDRVSLVSRYVLPYKRENGKRIRPPLEPEVAHKLMQIAVDIHDRQVQQSERWKVLIPMVVALISAGAAIAAAILSAGGAK